VSARRRRRASGVGGVLALGALALGLSGCGGGPGPAITTTAFFSDAGTLALGAPVKLADVPVGSVTGITLDGSRAKVTMSIAQRADVPANVIAKIDRTTILGERFVDLAVPRKPSGRLAAGAVIRRTDVVPTVEQVIGAGSEVFGAISASDLAEIVNAGGQGFSGEAAALRQFLDDTSAVAAGYASRTAEIQTVIGSLDRLGTSMAPTSGADADAISNLTDTVKVLAANAARFEQLLQSLNAVSAQGASIISSEYPQIVDQLQALQAVSNQLALHQQDLAELLEWLPDHDATMSESVRHNFLQIMNNLIVCGLPDGGSGQTAATTCAKQ
jgi:phospholipid/cholesterol/gamma-HCH transport system substrate-binding protein